MLKKIELIGCNLSEVPIDALPSTIQSLSMTSSALPSTWFQPLSVSSTFILPYLRELDLDLSELDITLDDVAVGHIARAWPQLKILKLNDRYPCMSCLREEGLRAIAVGLRQLEVLEIATKDVDVCNDVAIQAICANLAATLRRLNVSDCPGFCEQCAVMVATMLTNLQSLELRDTYLRNAGVLHFAQRTSLRYLNVAPTGDWLWVNAFDDDVIGQLKRALSACTIIH